MSEWVSKCINEIGEVVSGSTPSTSVPLYWNGDNLWFTPLDLSRNGTIYLNTSARRISLEGLKNIGNKLLPAHSLIISSRAPIGYLGIPLKDFAINQGCKTIIFNNGFISEYFYYYFTHYNAHLKRFGEGTTFLELSKKDLENLKVYIPTSELEQKHIAKILTTIDNVIEKTEAAIEKYKAIKQGMMHDLFTRGIDIKTGKLRPNYDDAPELYKESELGLIPVEWYIVSVEEILHNKNGAMKIGPFGSQLKKEFFVKDGFKVYGQENVYQNDFTIGERRISKIRFKLLQTCELFPGDVVISMMGTIGKCVIVPDNIERGIMDSHLLRLRIDKNKYCKEIFTQLIENSPLIKSQIQKYSVGGIMEGLSSKIINRLLFPKPSPDEQILIEDRLTEMDKVILIETKKLIKLKNIKQGLMQDLLTGKKRVKIKEPNEEPARVN